MYICTYTCRGGACADKCKCLQRSDESVGFPEALVTGDCEPTNVGSEDQTLVLQEQYEL